MWDCVWRNFAEINNNKGLIKRKFSSATGHGNLAAQIASHSRTHILKLNKSHFYMRISRSQINTDLDRLYDRLNGLSYVWSLFSDVTSFHFFLRNATKCWTHAKAYVNWIEDGVCNPRKSLLFASYSAWAVIDVFGKLLTKSCGFL